MITLEHKRSMLGESLEAKLARLDDLRPADKKARRSVMRSNKGIRFRAGHVLSHLVVEGGHIELGTRAPGYFKLLNLNGERLGEIYADWVVTGKH